MQPVSDSWLLEDIKPQFDRAIHVLQRCSDYTTHECMDAVRKLPVPTSKPLGSNVSQYLVESGFADLFPYITRSLQTVATYALGDQASMNLHLMKTVYLQILQKCPNMCSAFGRNNTIRLLLEYLADSSFTTEKLENAIKLDHVELSLGILHTSVRLSPDNRRIFRESNAVDVLTIYSQSRRLSIRLSALLCLSYIVEEDENEKVATAGGTLDFLMGLLKDAVKSKYHSTSLENSEFSVEVLLGGIIGLARNDKNKASIIKRGGTKILTNLLSDTSIEEEQLLAAKGLWMLSFVEDMKKKPGSSLIKRSQSLKLIRSKTLSLPLKSVCSGALWEIENAQKKEQKSKKYRKSDGEVKGDRSLVQKHIMISYQWNAKERMIQLKDKLTTEGYKIWMDVDCMEDDILQSMADGVEQSSVVLVCASREYKDSRNCRTEASYAYKLSVKSDLLIIPLLVEEGYTPDGWLGALFATRVYYKFTSDDDLTTQFQSLIRALGDRGRNIGTDGTTWHR